MIRNTLSILLLGAVFLLAGPAGKGPAPTYAQSCISQGQAQALVASGQAPPFSAFYASLQQQGQVVSSCMIQAGGGYKYSVKLLKPNGQVVSVIGP